MLTFIIRRLLWGALTLLFISFLTFVIFYTLPSADPALLRAGRVATPELVASIRETLGLDRPWYVQLGIYWRDLFFNFDFGQSYQNNADVKELIFSRLPATLTVAAGGALVWLLIGIPIGILAAIKHGTWQDKTVMGLALVAISAPVYWLGLVALYLFDETIGQFPLIPGAGAYPQNGDHLFDAPGTVIQALIMPWFVLAAAFAASYSRFMRGNLTEVMGEDYIRTARAKGLRERRVVLKHGTRSAVTPIVTILGLDLGILLGGAILTETVFNIPGIGRLAYSSIQTSDLPTVQGTVVLGAFFIILMNIIVDVVYAFLDPRVRY